MLNKKDIFSVILLGCTATGAYTYGKHHGAVNHTHDYGHKPCTIELIATDDQGKAKGIRFSFTPDQRDALLDKTPLAYEIPQLNVRFALPIDDRMSTATTTFRDPQRIEDAILRIYARDPDMGVPLTIYETPLSTIPRSK